MKFRIVVKQSPGATIPIYYPQFKVWYWFWVYYDKREEDVFNHLGFFFKTDADMFIRQRYNSWLAEGGKSILPWKPYQ